VEPLLASRPGTTASRAGDVNVGSGSLRIGVLAPPWFAVPPRRYGGIEAVVALLTEELVARGHEVTLFASADSCTSAHLVAVHHKPRRLQLGYTLPELEHVLACIRRARAFDVISDHSGPLAFALSGLIETPFVHTVHNALDRALAPAYDAAIAVAPNARMVSLSPQQRHPRPAYPWIANVPNAVDLLRFACRERTQGEYLLWIGRMCFEKGPDRAIEVAQQARLPILLAGKMHTPQERDYFAHRVAPRLGGHAQYVGEADKSTIVSLLHGAIALVNPIEWDEPFGLTMIEAMACGVPVIATRRGAVPEIVVDGVTGMIVDDYRAMAEAIPEAADILPSICRAIAEERFSPHRLAERYVNAFHTAIRQNESRAAVGGTSEASPAAMQ
jgi:glycosyltransferase involved in cell wall biosynthesis